MKKISFILVAGLVMAFASCKKTQELPEGGPATYAVKASSETVYPKLSKNGSQIVMICATTSDLGIRDQLTATFKIGGQKDVDAYNKTVSEEMQATLLPAGTYDFEKNDVTIDRYNKSSRSATIKVTNTPTLEGNMWYALPVQLQKVAGSDLASVDSLTTVVFAFYAQSLDKGDGTKEKPYLIYEVEDMLKIAEQCKPISDDSSLEKAEAATPTYFKMMADIDLSGIDWIPYNYKDNFMRKIDFNGNHKTISNLRATTSSTYASLFGVLFGTVYDLNVKDAYVSSNQTAGIMCGYLGTGNKRGNIHNCSVQGKVESNSKYIGGLCGQNAVGGEIYECYVDAEVVLTANNNFVGGLIGYEKGQACHIHDCIVKGSVTGYINASGGGTQRVGGVMGMLYIEGSTVTNCIALNTLKACRSIGGICGHANKDKWDEQHPKQTIQGCIAWNPEIITTQISEDGASNGAIVGFASEFNTYMNCWRKADMKYTLPASGGFAVDPVINPDGKFNTFFDQDNCSESSPLQGIVHDNSKKLYRCPYNGKAAAGSETASAVAKKIGWSEEIWDLSGDVPSLKRVYAE